MKAVILIVAMAVLSGCASSTPRVKAPDDNSLFSSYRQTHEVLGIQCITEKTNTHYRSSYKPSEVMVVESTKTGERFTVQGCLGKAGERFKISY
jgi:predicted component of type VI protein secretion system